MNSVHEKYMARCIKLAKSGMGSVSPNPMVGSVIVCENKIIGEGFHRKYGEAHAEVNAINSVEDKSLLCKSTIYVSLEPCAHIGKTPSCADLLIEMKIPQIVIGSIDPYFQVAGKGIQKLKAANREIITGVLEKECISLNRRFYTYHIKKRPYIILKWAESNDGFIDYLRTKESKTKAQWITNEYCKTLVHKWRTEEDAFLVGTNTVILDNPQLTARNWSGKNPIRITIDEDLCLDKSHKIFDNQAETIIFNKIKNQKEINLNYRKISFEIDIIPQILENLYEMEVQSVVVEGGLQTLESFISLGLWDEARVFYGQQGFGNGVLAPMFDYHETKTKTFGNSKLKSYYKNEYV
jgi:diaminohydroxyphosphoribosylaminopyrimidine deaminase/5-amino-6-(5-phosphoribosylamino)uracil reductase